MKTREIISEGTYVGGNSPLDVGTPKQAGEIVRRLALKEISFSLFCHGNTPSQPGLKNKNYLAIDGSQSDYEYAKEVVDLLMSGN